MFKKKPNIKPLAPLRSSDRRKTADQIISDLGLGLSSVENDQATQEEKAATIVELSGLRNSLLPENALSGRFTTTHGPNLKQVSGTVYVASHSGEDQRVLWVKIGDRMYPTVYTLWQNPGILPLLHTPSLVVSKLQGGADLMTPGLAHGPPFPTKAKKGSIVAIASTESPSVPVVVGICEIDVSALQHVQGAKGQAVQTVTWSGDELWAWSATGKAGVVPPEHMDGWLEESEASSDLPTRMDKFTLQDENRGEEGGGVGLNPTEVENMEELASVGNVESSTTENQKQWTTAEIDIAFRNAFLYGVRQYKESNTQAHHGLDFPLKQSFVMSKLVQPFLPAFTKADADALQIKKTSWKNVRKFVKYLDKERILKSKDRDNEALIMDVDFEDQAILRFEPYPIPKRELAAVSASSGRAKTAEASDTSDASIGQSLKIVIVYKANQNLSPLFGTSADSRSFHTATDLKSIVESYIESENLVSEPNKRLVSLNPFLSNTVFDGQQANDKDILRRGNVPRDNLTDRIKLSCSPFYVILRNSSTPDANMKPKPGHAPRIQITLETRSGNKTVTKVSGLESYYILPQPLADELRKTCAGSTSVEKMVGSSSKNPVMEVMIQGPQREAVIAALEKRGIDKRWVDVIDKTKKKR